MSEETKESLKEIMETEAYKIAYKFAADLYNKLGPIVKSVVLFGSLPKGKAKEDSDIDIMIIIDNTLIPDWPSFKQYLQTELSKMISENKEYSKLHINVVTLTVFWEGLLQRDPVIMNILRVGIPIFDLGGFFAPLQRLLEEGKLAPSKEAVLYALSRVPYHLGSAKAYKMKSLEFLYWAMTDSAQALIMAVERVNPPSPEEIKDYLEKLAKKNIVPKIFARWYEEMYNLVKSVAKGKKTDIEGVLLDLWRKRAEIFTRRIYDKTMKLVNNLP